MATEATPSPSPEALQASGGPPSGHFGSRPVSRDTLLRSGPRHWGQNPGARSLDLPSLFSVWTAYRFRPAAPWMNVGLSLSGEGAHPSSRPRAAVREKVNALMASL